jgi:hypothetical protein
MKKTLLLVLVLFSTFGTINAQQNTKKVLRHVVLFGWNQGTDPAYINKIVTAFGDLPKQISLVKSFEWGLNNSPENLNQGLTHCFTITFESESDRDAYLIHPAHKAFVALLNPAPDKVTVFDYWVTSIKE